jgi:GNAT superfamily N-acetyltransferase
MSIDHASPAAGRDAPGEGIAGLACWVDTLPGGERVLLRPIEPGDRDAERAFIAALSPEARHDRFLGQVVAPGEDLLTRLTEPDMLHDVAYVALAAGAGDVPGAAPGAPILGVARYGADRDGRACECAVTVAEGWRQRGLATRLMRHLIDLARARGIRTMYSIDAADNAAMRALAADLGFTRNLDPDDAAQVIHHLDLRASAPDR